MCIRRTVGSDDQGRVRAGRSGRGRVRAAARAIPGARILLALKTALAAATAWVVAQYMPGVIDDYPYYAPLGALSAMYPTILGSVRTGLQTVAGLALGLGLAAGVLFLGDPNLLTISLAVGIGALLSGVRRLGAGAEYVPMAALFALIIGGHDGGAYSLGFLVQMAVGVGIGLVVNVVVFPPLDFRTARLQLDRLQAVVVDYLEDIAGELSDPGTTSERDWVRRSQQLSKLTVEVREAVEKSAASTRGNPRVLLTVPERRTDPGYAALKKLEPVVFHLRDLTDVLREICDPPTGQWTVPDPITTLFAEAVQAGAACVQAWSSDEDPTEQAETVRALLKRLYDGLGALAQVDQRLVNAVAEDLERLVNILDPPSPAENTPATGRH